MSKSATSAMKFESMPVNKRKVGKVKKSGLKAAGFNTGTPDPQEQPVTIRDMATRSIVAFVYKRHQVGILYTALFLCAVWGVSEAIR